MPKRPRIRLDGVPLHIVRRGHNRGPCFFPEEDYGSYLHWPGEALGETECAQHVYVLMTNHVHLLLTPTKAQAVPKLLIFLGRTVVPGTPREGFAIGLAKIRSRASFRSPSRRRDRRSSSCRIRQLPQSARSGSRQGKSEMARRMDTSRPQLERLLDPHNEGVTLDTLTKAAAALGRKVRLELV